MVRGVPVKLLQSRTTFVALELRISPRLLVSASSLVLYQVRRYHISGWLNTHASSVDIDEAASLNYGYQNTSIYSCSWGPADDGRSMEAPGYLVEKAVVNGINKGRAGKGSVFVFAAGNGAANGDQCNFDGYTNSIYSITVAAVDYKGLHPYYSEPCAANMVVAYTSGSGNHIVSAAARVVEDLT